MPSVIADIRPVDHQTPRDLEKFYGFDGQFEIMEAEGGRLGNHQHKIGSFHSGDDRARSPGGRIDDGGLIGPGMGSNFSDQRR